MNRKVFSAVMVAGLLAGMFLNSRVAEAQAIWPEEVLVGNWGKVSIYKGADNSRVFPYPITPSDLSTYSGCKAGDYLFEYKLTGDLNKLTREMFALSYLPEIDQVVTITATSGSALPYYKCAGEEKFKWGAGFCDKFVVVLTPQPQGPSDRIWFCATRGGTGPIDVAVGTSSLQPGKNVILGPGFDQFYLPVTTTQFTKVSNVCLKTVQNVLTKCIEAAYYASVPSNGECSDVGLSQWSIFGDYGSSGAIYTGTPNAGEACDQTLEIPPQEDLDRILAGTSSASAVYLDVLSDKAVSDTQTTCVCPPCIKYTIRGYLKCACP